MQLLSHVDWPVFLFAMVTIELTPGPNMGWLAALSAQSGRRAGLVAVAGVTLGLTLQLFAAATGLSAIAAKYRFVYESLRWGGVAFMLYLAFEAWRMSGESSPARHHNNGVFAKGLVANLLNPKAVVFYLMVIGQFTSAVNGAVWMQIMLLGCIHLVVALIIHVVIVFLGARLGEGMLRWQQSLVVRSCFAAALISIAVWIAVSTGLET